MAEDVLTLILDGVITELREVGRGDPCITALMPGLEVPLDYCMTGECDAGMVWARLVGITPQAQTDATGIPCAGDIDAQVEVAVIGPAPPVREAGDSLILPTSEDHTSATQRQLQEMQAMYKVITCTQFPGGRGQVTAYGPIGPQGTCVGGAWLATIPLV